MSAGALLYPTAQGKVHEISGLETEEDLAMASNAISELKVNTKQNGVREERATESSTPLTLKQRLGAWLRDVFEGH